MTDGAQADGSVPTLSVEAPASVTPPPLTPAPSPGSFLARLRRVDQDFLLSDCAPRPFPANTVLFHRGDPSDFVVFLLSGWAKVFMDSLNGHEALLALRGPGDVLGELAALDGRPRSATVQTLVPARVAVLSADRFLGRLRQRPDIAIALLGHVADRLRDSDSRRLGFGAHTVPERLAAYLLELAHRHGTAAADGTVIDVPLSQRDLAGAVGASREAIARCLRILRDRRVVVTSRRRIVIRRPEVLRAMGKNVHSDAEDQC